jgi:hypothetical protein
MLVPEDTPIVPTHREIAEFQKLAADEIVDTDNEANVDQYEVTEDVVAEAETELEGRHIILSSTVSPEVAKSLRERIEEWPWTSCEHVGEIFFNPCETVHVHVKDDGSIKVDILV